MYRAVLFDLDGTLIDSEPLWCEVYGRLFAFYGAQYNAEIHGTIMGGTAEACMTALRERFSLNVSVEELIAKRNSLFEAVLKERGGLSAKPGVKALIDALHAAGVPLGLGSNARAIAIRRALDTVGIDGQLGDPVGSDEVKHGKPAPDVYLAAAKQLGIDPKDCLVVEDSLIGCQSAHAAGMDILGILDTTFLSALPLAKKTIQTFEGMTIDDVLAT